MKSKTEKEEKQFESLKEGVSEFFELRFEPSWELGVVIISWFLVVGGLYTAFQVFTTRRVALNFIMYGPVSLLVFGTLLPLIFNSVVKGRPLSDIGVTGRSWLPSIALGLGLGVNTYLNTVASTDLPALNNLIPLVTMSLTVGLFEAIFFRGWIQLRLENAFGAIPAIILGAAFYAFYHFGYGMTMSEVWFLFTLGLQFALAFRITKNVLVLWPFYTWIGGLYTNLEEGLVLPLEATYGFIIVLVFMLVSIVLVWKRNHGRSILSITSRRG